jgi:D-glycero-D-manno-heptose 1,7-bisphosphate phosphatase
VQTVVQKAVFFDRDGTIIVDANYLSDPAGVVLIPGAMQALSLLREFGFLLFLHTNQSGVGRGLFPIDVVHRCNDRMLDLLGLDGPVFTEICIAPEHPDQPVVYRKPSPRFINECVEKYTLDKGHTWMVGDKASDVQAGLNAGVRSALVGTAGAGMIGAGVECFGSLMEFAASVSTRKS